MNKRLRIFLIIVWMILQNMPVCALLQDMQFHTLESRDGLSNSQVNDILKDHNGFMWFATQSGLDRYDGFRFKNFFFDSNDKSSLPNNFVDGIQQDAEDNLWVHTSMGYCIYDYMTETFDVHIDVWMQKHGMKKDYPDKVYIDSQKNMWFSIYGKGVYFYHAKTGKHVYFSQGGSGVRVIPKGEITSMQDVNGRLIAVYKDGTLMSIDGLLGRVKWIKRYPSLHLKNHAGYKLIVDKHSNYWVIADDITFVYSAQDKKWYEGCNTYLISKGIKIGRENILVHDVQEDDYGRTWIATDHQGLFVVDWKTSTFSNYTYQRNQQGCVPDNTLHKIYIDNLGSVWLGAYKNGVGFYSPHSSLFSTIYLGDICTIGEDKNGVLWCGTNDKGIVAYNRVTGTVQNFSSSITGLGSEVIVSSLMASDGSMYFGTYNGGMVRYSHGQWKVFRSRKGSGGLSNDNVWCLEEDQRGNVIIGTLGGGVQVYNPKTDRFTTYNTDNSELPSNYVFDLCLMQNGQILIGHSLHYSIFNVAKGKFTNIKSTSDGRSFLSPSVTSIIEDSRGMIWMATPSGVTMYHPLHNQLEVVNGKSNHHGTGCSVIEDLQHRVWVVYDHQITCVTPSAGRHGYELSSISYSSLDGLQTRQFNERSVLITRKGEIVVGGQDGINIIQPKRISSKKSNPKVIFSGLILLGHPLSVGEKFNGRVVLSEILDKSRKVELQSNESDFTILLASNEVTLPSRSRFLYRLNKGTEEWLMTPEDKPSITFTNLSYGHYILEIKVVNADGTISDNVSQLEIVVEPPFYLSIWAILCYVVLLILGFLYYRNHERSVQQAAFRERRLEENALKDKQLNELKLNFFTNISHELRTPLTLIISPLASMIKKEEDEDKRYKLKLIHRNAERLLTLVNQILDFRKLDKNKETLNLLSGDIVSFIKNICDSFDSLGNDSIQLSFYSAEPQLIMEFDSDKINKSINNLLSNAYKFTPDGGLVSVQLHVMKRGDGEQDTLEIRVSDTGKGISDEDKNKIFNSFYQVNGTEMKPTGGSGIGLNITKRYVEMHDGTIHVEDNPVGGSIFVIQLPVRLPEDMSDSLQDTMISSVAEPVEHIKVETPQVQLSHKPVVLLVDDSDDFREFMREELSDHYEVVEAENGKVALEKIAEHRPHIILSDVMMPVMDGNEFCRLLKGNPATANIPVIMLTARLTMLQKIEGLEHGADDYITKPFSMDLLRLRMANLMTWASRQNHHTKGNGDMEAIGADAISTPCISESDRKLLTKVDRYIHDHLDDPDLSVEVLSQEVAMSRVQLYKRMVPLTGSTPSEYIRAKRLEAAEKLLLKGELTVSEIAYHTGFNNPRYFSKYFAEAYGQTPSQYKKHRGN